ncbi:MAG: protein translocase subunit SecD [Elusimicrobiota bacterium]
MNKITQWKITVTLLLLGAAVWFLYPTFSWYSKPSQERTKLREVEDPLVGKILNLGLDLQGGMHLMLEVDLEKAPEELDKKDAMDQALEIMRNRVDQFGVSEPLIARQGDRWIVVQLPGVKEPDRALDLIGRTALLEFRLISEEEIPGEDEEVPEGFEILEDRRRNRFLVEKEAELTGAALEDAKVNVGGEFGQPRINFYLKDDAADKFEDITAANVDRRLAIVLDGVVQSAPVIRDRIPGGQGIIEGQFDMESARDLAIVLRAGALPAPVKIIENRTIGPSLGRDSITDGVTAMLIGFIVVLAFMMMYYKKAGIIADVALVMNIILLLGAMAYFRFTLTLPGIAGIILIIGMAVDANVLIFERIREELKLGKTPRVAIDAGYSKATTTILDANITTLIAAAFLFQFGTGPVKGFAVTLFIGIVASVFTAIVVSKTIFELLTQERKIEEISI